MSDIAESIDFAGDTREQLMRMNFEAVILIVLTAANAFTAARTGSYLPAGVALVGLLCALVIARLPARYLDLD